MYEVCNLSLTALLKIRLYVRIGHLPNATKTKNYYVKNTNFFCIDISDHDFSKFKKVK